MASDDPTPDMDNDHGRAIAMLSEKLQIPMYEVQEIYSKEFDRLASQARIGLFLGVLTLRNTRSILRSGNGHAGGHCFGSRAPAEQSP